MRTNRLVTLCILALLMGTSVGCRKSTGGRSFSFNFDSDKEDALTIALAKHESLCRELESRDFQKVKMGETLEMKYTEYEGEYANFPLTVKIQYRLSISAEEPEFTYRASFEETRFVDALNKAADDLRALMREWCGQPQAAGNS